MLPMRNVSAPARSLLLLLLGLLLALRLMNPAGFMPAFDHGAVSIVACPSAEPDLQPARTMHHGHKATHHDPCPYASASALAALGINFSLLADVLVLTAVLLLGRAYVFIERHARRLRPPLRGPPIPA